MIYHAVHNNKYNNKLTWDRNNIKRHDNETFQKLMNKYWSEQQRRLQLLSACIHKYGYMDCRYVS